MIDSPIAFLFNKNLDTNTLAAQFTTATCILMSAGYKHEAAAKQVLTLFSGFDEFLRSKVQKKPSPLD